MHPSPTLQQYQIHVVHTWKKKCKWGDLIIHDCSCQGKLLPHHILLGIPFNKLRMSRSHAWVVPCMGWCHPWESPAWGNQKGVGHGGNESLKQACQSKSLYAGNSLDILPSSATPKATLYSKMAEFHNFDVFFHQGKGCLLCKGTQRALSMSLGQKSNHWESKFNLHSPI